MPELDKTRLLALASVAVLLVLLTVVLVLLVRAIRRAKRQQVEEPLVLDPMNEQPQSQDEADLTRLKAFTPDLLPKLSFDEPGEDEDEPITEDSQPNLSFEGDSRLGVDEPTGPHSLIVTSAASLSDRGRKRSRNEDACLVDAELDLYLVADGMGGYAGGDVAANTAVAEVRKAIQAARPVAQPADWPRRGRELAAAIERANEVIYDIGAKSKELHGMGTTILAARFSRPKQRVYVAHVGDSRVYRFRGGRLDQITVDHTLGAKGVVGPLASNVRRAVGVGATVKVDVVVDKPLPEDLYVLCSDGMYKMVSVPEIERILSEKRTSLHWTAEDLKNMVSAMVVAANAAGGKDNITVVIIGVRDAAVAERSESQKKTEARV